ncbi:FAD-dependent monooxygenase, partial [Clostridium perfringens]
ARAVDAAGNAIEISCAYLVGCDGGRSGVRKAIGASLSGDVALQYVQSSYIRAPDLLPMLHASGGVPAWASFALNPQQSG